MILKEGVSIDKLTPPMRNAATAIEACYAALGVECVVTSGDEPETMHKGRPVVGGILNPHYEGKALDFRLWNVPSAARPTLVMEITEELGPDYVVLWEIGPHLIRHLGGVRWSVTCLTAGTEPEHLMAPIPETCDRCGKAMRGAIPHLHVQAGHVA